MAGPARNRIARRKTESHPSQTLRMIGLALLVLSGMTRSSRNWRTSSPQCSQWRWDPGIDSAQAGQRGSMAWVIKSFVSSAVSYGSRRRS